VRVIGPTWSIVCSIGKAAAVGFSHPGRALRALAGVVELPRRDAPARRPHHHVPGEPDVTAAGGAAGHHRIARLLDVVGLRVAARHALIDLVQPAPDTLLAAVHAAAADDRAELHVGRAEGQHGRRIAAAGGRQEVAQQLGPWLAHRPPSFQPRALGVCSV
jgi:hypothetical protein